MAFNKNLTFTRYFYEIVQYLWNWENKITNTLIDNFINDIKKEYSNMYFNNLKILFEFILLKLHDEQKIITNGNEATNNTKNNILNERFENIEVMNTNYSLTESFIQNNFFLN